MLFEVVVVVVVVIAVDQSLLRYDDLFTADFNEELAASICRVIEEDYLKTEACSFSETFATNHSRKRDVREDCNLGGSIVWTFCVSLMVHTSRLGLIDKKPLTCSRFPRCKYSIIICMS